MGLAWDQETLEPTHSGTLPPQRTHLSYKDTPPNPSRVSHDEETFKDIDLWGPLCYRLHTFNTQFPSINFTIPEEQNEDGKKTLEESKTKKQVDGLQILHLSV